MKPAGGAAKRRVTILAKATVIAGCAALTLAGCSGTTTTVNGRAVSVLYDPADAGGLPVTDGPSGRRSNAPQPTGTVKNTDNGDIDHLALLALNDIEEFWKQNYPDGTKNPFKAVSTLVSYDSRDPQSPVVCRQIKTYKNLNAAYVYTCNLVMWDRGVLVPSAKKYFGEMAPVGIIAHEFGHAMQFNGGIVSPRSTPTLVKEQQADCFAGVYLRWVAEGHSSRFTLTTGDALSHVIAGLLKISDPISTEEDYQESQDQAHGTGLDRISAFQMGFDSGSGTCTKIDMNEIKNRRGDEPLALQQDSSGDTDNGEVTINQDNISTLVEILNKVFSPKSPPSVSYTATSCADAKPTKGSSYCPATNTVSVDLPTLQEIGKPGGRKGMTDPMMLQGDNTAMSIVASRYVLAVQHERGLPLDSPVAAVRTACLTGAAQRNMAQVVSVPSGKQLVLTAGDLDKAIIGLLMNGVAASDVNGEHMPAGFTRALAFRGGVLDNIDQCFQRIT
jgi:predicted metalloprotease